MTKMNRLGAVLAAAALSLGVLSAQAGAVEVRKTSHAGSGMAMAMPMHHGMMKRHHRHHMMMRHPMMKMHMRHHHHMMMHKMK